MLSRGNTKTYIFDSPAIDDDIRKWYRSIDLKILAAGLMASHLELEEQLIGEVMFYITCRAAELEI